MNRLVFLVAVVVVALACEGEAPSETDADTGITFMPPDASAEPDASSDASVDAPMPPPEVPPCTTDDECTGDLPVCVPDDQLRDGYCSEFCLLDAPEDTCPEGTHCTPMGFMRGLCMPACDPDLERPCRVGFGCGERAPEASVCAPGCDVDEDCPAGLLCNRTDGILGQGECYDPDAALTDPCTEPEDCNSDSWCIRERDLCWPGGAYTTFRCNDVDDSGCPGDAHCVFDFYRDPICVDGCETDDDCRPGYACEPDEMFPDRVRCTPRCTDDAECLEVGHHCDVESGRCVL